MTKTIIEQAKKNVNAKFHNGKVDFELCTESVYLNAIQKETLRLFVEWVETYEIKDDPDKTIWIPRPAFNKKLEQEGIK